MDAHTIAREGSVTVAEPERATILYPFAYRDVSRARRLAIRDTIERECASLGEIEEMRIRPPCPLAWAENQAAPPFAKGGAAKGRGGARPYPLARVLVLYPSWAPDPEWFRPLLVTLPDGRVVPGASDEACALLGKARLYFRRMILSPAGRQTREVIRRSRRQERAR